MVKLLHKAVGQPHRGLSGGLRPPKLLTPKCDGRGPLQPGFLTAFELLAFCRRRPLNRRRLAHLSGAGEVPHSREMGEISHDVIEKAIVKN